MREYYLVIPKNNSNTDRDYLSLRFWDKMQVKAPLFANQRVNDLTKLMLHKNKPVLSSSENQENMVLKIKFDNDLDEKGLACSTMNDDNKVMIDLTKVDRYMEDVQGFRPLKFSVATQLMPNGDEITRSSTIPIVAKKDSTNKASELSTNPMKKKFDYMGMHRVADVTASQKPPELAAKTIIEHENNQELQNLDKQVHELVKKIRKIADDIKNWDKYGKRPITNGCYDGTDIKAPSLEERQQFSTQLAQNFKSLLKATKGYTEASIKDFKENSSKRPQSWRNEKLLKLEDDRNKCSQVIALEKSRIKEYEKDIKDKTPMPLSYYRSNLELAAMNLERVNKQIFYIEQANKKFSELIGIKKLEVKQQYR